jgi:tetratricopeptide (TPR) repeat protein
MTILLLLCAFFATKPNYDTRDKVRAQELTMVIKQKQEEQRLIAEQKAAREKSRLDSLNYYINLSEDKKSRRRYSEAVVQLNHALRFATDIDTAIYAAKANCNFLAKNYDNAIKDYQKLVSKGKDVALNKYHIAVIYVRQSKIKEAVYELQPAMNQGHNKALALHEKINPLIREVAYYVTRCCDGSTSSAKGRGACSHHGGVCNWNDHVYREYRKY